MAAIALMAATLPGEPAARPAPATILRYE